MEWNRTGRPSQHAGQPAAPAPSAPAAHHIGSTKRPGRGIFPGRLVTVVLLFSVTILIVAVISFLMFGKSATEKSYVDDEKMQAVFLNGGQVYFGRINALNTQFVHMYDIYYLRVNQQVQPDQKDKATGQQDISLVKLGCELHGPQDEMLINRQQVVFWENLKEDGQVAKAVAEYKKANPDGQKCQTNQQTTATPPAATPAPAATPTPVR